MDLYNVHFELAATGFLILVIVSFYRQKHLDLRRNRLYEWLLVLLLGTTFLDAVTGYLS